MMEPWDGPAATCIHRWFVALVQRSTGTASSIAVLYPTGRVITRIWAGALPVHPKEILEKDGSHR